MIEFDENNLPFVRTRQALLALDLQTDFLSPNAAIPVQTPPDFVDNILNLASNFRSSGNLIWIRTVFEASRPVNSAEDSETVITDAELPADASRRKRPTLQPKLSQKLAEQFAKIAEAMGELSDSDDEEVEKPGVDKKDQISETYLTLEPGEKPHVVSQSPGANMLDSVAQSVDTKKDLVLQKTYYSAFKDGSLVQTLRAKFVTEIYICGTLTNISVFATAIDAARHGYAITLVDDCLGYRSKARHDESLRRLVDVTGCSIISSADLIRDIKVREGARSIPRPSQRQPPTERPKTRGADLYNLMANLNLRPDGSTAPRPNATSTKPPKSMAAAVKSSESLASSEPAEELTLPTKKPSSDVKKERVKTKIRSRRRNSKSGSKDVAAGCEAAGASSVEKSSSAATEHPKVDETLSRKTPSTLEKEMEKELEKETKIATPRDSFDSSTEHLEVDETLVKTAKGKGREDQGKPVSWDLDAQVKRMAKLSVKEEPSRLCEGDTIIIHDLLDAEVAEGIFERVRDEVRWQKMSHQRGDVPRLVAVQGEISEDGSVPIYRHPADESLPLLSYSPVVSEIRKSVEKKLGHPVNHVLIQYYRDGNDYISEHSDKTLDIVPDTFIANVSLGAQRTMVFRTKKPEKTGDENPKPEAIQSRLATRVPLPHNSMCRMGLVTNMHWLHGIRQDKRMISEKSAEELAFDGGRISLTFRQIGTFLSKDQTKIWGQGATSKTRKDAKTVINGDNAESEKMIRAFSKENHSSEFDWKEHYGEGFDVLHIENSPKLFLSGDSVADLRVKLLLAEYEIEWSEGKLSPAFHWKNGSSSKDSPPVPETLPVKFVDDDLGKPTVVGDLAIMLYLDAVYRPKPDTSKSSQIDLARQFSCIQQSSELLKKWRAQPFSVKPFRRELELWDAFAVEGQFIAGEKISLADYALWPLLHDIHGEWDTFDGLEHLAAYYKRLKESKTFVKALGVKKENEGTELETEENKKEEPREENQKPEPKPESKEEKKRKKKPEPQPEPEPESKEEKKKKPEQKVEVKGEKMDKGGDPKNEPKKDAKKDAKKGDKRPELKKGKAS